MARSLPNSSASLSRRAFDPTIRSSRVRKGEHMPTDLGALDGMLAGTRYAAYRHEIVPMADRNHVHEGLFKIADADGSCLALFHRHNELMLTDRFGASK